VLDSTAAATIAGFVDKERRGGAAVHLSGARPAIRRVLATQAVEAPAVAFHETLDDAVLVARAG
jgi:SulP family sulfate permease